MAVGESGLATQVFALAKDLAKAEKDIQTLGERDANVRAALARLGPVQEALDHLEERTSGLQAEVKELTPLREGLNALSKQVKKLTQDLEALASKEEKIEVWNWSLQGGMDKEEAGQAWETLLAWVRSELQAGYGWVGPPADMFAKNSAGAFPPVGSGPMTAPRIPPCWYRHKEAVLELSPLCQEWIKIHRTSYGTPSRALDWHTQAQNAKRRVINALTKCMTETGHQDDPWTIPEQPWTINPNVEGAPRATDDDAELSRYIQWDLYYRPDAPAPGPVAAE